MSHGLASGGAISKLLAIAMVSLAALGQPSGPSFDAASVKPATPLGPLGMRADRKGGPETSDPGMYTCKNCPIGWVVSEAFDLQPFELKGPDWLQDVRFDFMAKVPAGTTKAAFRIMLQNLLSDRFLLKVHRESREMQVYELTAAKSGSKLRESVSKDGTSDSGTPGPIRRDKDGFPILAGTTTMAVVPGHARIQVENQPMSWLVRMLTGQLGGPVVDATGLKAKYDFLVSWAFEENRTSAASAEAAPGGVMLDAYRPALIQAVQSQLGLKLEQKKGAAEVLVVDHIEKSATPN